VTRSTGDRVADVRRLLSAAEAVFHDRAGLAEAIATTTGLSPEGVELGFASLERDATDGELRALVAAAGDVPSVHVVLSANVFVAPLRALALARAAAERVTVCPSRRDPVLARALVERLAAGGDGAVRIVDERDAAAIDADEIHVYGRDETLAAIRARVAATSRRTVRGHGAGLGVAIVSSGIDVDVAAERVARDVVPFDQRGCLSPRFAIVLGDDARAGAFARALHERLGAWSTQVPRGALTSDERVEAQRWRGTMAFAGELFEGAGHVVALAPPGTSWWLPPSGRHIQVMAHRDMTDLAARLAPIVPVVVAVGTDDPSRVLAALPLLAAVRSSALGQMQRPALDGPVDLRKRQRSP
jgi:hypothetical protein